MDKKLILAVAGSGKTTYIVNLLNAGRRTLIITYTDANYENIVSKIRMQNDGIVPTNVTVFTYFTFLFQFCFKPFLSDECPSKGITFDADTNRFHKQNQKDYYIDKTGRLYSNRLSLLLEKCNVIEDIRKRIEKYFDLFVVDEVQDISGRDFNFLESLFSANVDMLYVGDFYQHTYSTSFDGNVNASLFADRNKYIKRYSQKGIKVDFETLERSWRCGDQVCNFVRDNLGIPIESSIGSTGSIEYIDRPETIEAILRDTSIIKLHYQKANQFGFGHKNWGETKGEDCYQDVCVLLNKTTLDKYRKNELSTLAELTKNKLYVALTRARGNVYLIDESRIDKP